LVLVGLTGGDDLGDVVDDLVEGRGWYGFVAGCVARVVTAWSP
jgi:hypothetical protein